MGNIIQIDARGEQCPLPVVKAKKALESLEKAGGVLILVDNEIAVQNLGKLASQKGMEFSFKKQGESHYEAFIATKGLAVEGKKTLAGSLDTTGDYVVAVDSAVMGSGNQELGKVLMKGFLYALTQLEELPGILLFYNGGATLTTQGSDSLEDLRFLEGKGVVIRTCGTCLSYYELTDKLEVGEVTNMYDIAETLSKAAKIIKP